MKHFINIFQIDKSNIKYAHNDNLKIKLEIDTNPPSGANYEIKYLLNPIPFSVKTFDLPSLFAGKIHALICREWKIRVKGRDFYDYLWFLSRNIPVNLYHAEQRLKHNHFIKDNIKLTKELLIEILENRFSNVDCEQVKKDIRPFVSSNYDLSIWSYNFFVNITNDKLNIV